MTTNDIYESILSAIQAGSAVTTTAGQGGSIDLSSTDASSITADAGGVAIAIAVGAGGGGGALSVGFAQATNTIGNTTTSEIDSSLVTADGGVSITASSLASIDALSFGGSGSVGAGSNVGVALAGAGAGASNNVDDNTYAFILDCQSGRSYGVTATTGSVALSATDGPSIFSTTHGGSVAIAASATFAVGLAITAVQSFNTIMDTVESYIDSSQVTTSSPTGQVTLLATTPKSSQIESDGIAVSVGGGISEGSAGFAGGGAGATNMITNTVAAYIDDGANVQAGNLISVTTTDNAQITSSVGAYAVAFGEVGASIGASIQSSTVNNMVSAYINAPVTVVNGDIMVISGSNVSVTGTAVATSVAVGGGAFAGSGDNTTSAIGGTVQAFVGPSGVLTIPSNGSVTIQATSSQDAEADSHGYAVSVGIAVVAIGVSLGTATLDGTTQAYMCGTLLTGQSLNVLATNTGTADATIFALAGGIGLGGAARGPRARSTSTRP